MTNGEREARGAKWSGRDRMTFPLEWHTLGREAELAAEQLAIGVTALGRANSIAASSPVSWRKRHKLFNGAALSLSAGTGLPGDCHASRLALGFSWNTKIE